VTQSCPGRESLRQESCSPSTGQCVHDPLPDSTNASCADTDGNACTIPGCAAGVCVETHETVPGCEEICRTPGFWGTHADEDPDKQCSQNITQAVIDAAGSLRVCGETISTTNVDDAASAIEAICVKVRGDSRRQLARQLTAAALNCVVTGVAANDRPQRRLLGASIAGSSRTATTDRAWPVGHRSVGDCIAAIDCFNNGGSFNAGDHVRPRHRQQLP
jgi:hypothetical protein